MLGNGSMFAADWYPNGEYIIYHYFNWLFDCLILFKYWNRSYKERIDLEFGKSERLLFMVQQKWYLPFPVIFDLSFFPILPSFILLSPLSVPFSFLFPFSFSLSLTQLDVMEVRFGPGGNVVYTGSRDGQLRALDMRQASIIHVEFQRQGSHHPSLVHNSSVSCFYSASLFRPLHYACFDGRHICCIKALTDDNYLLSSSIDGAISYSFSCFRVIVFDCIGT